MSDYRRLIQLVGNTQDVKLPTNWSGLDALIPLLEKIRASGVIVVLKLDGQSRTQQPYIAIFTGGVLGDAFIRVTAANLEIAICEAVINYARRFWEFSD
jgi:hypothetical protein